MSKLSSGLSLRENTREVVKREELEPLVQQSGPVAARVRRLKVASDEPFLRWAGGKRWLLPTILGLLGGRPIDRYFEPFLGGASVFLGVGATGEAFLSDLNGELIEVYAQVRDAPDAVSVALGKYENTRECYYAARAESPRTPTLRAARFIFLNHTSFNGIHRVNLRGEYNVPYGFRKSVRIPTRDELRAASRRLQRATLSVGDFDASLDRVKAGDFVFLDPPYTVAHNDNGFIKYNQHLFSFGDQQRLAQTIARLNEQGVAFVLTNAAHESIEELFGPLGRTIGVSRRNAIGGKLAARGRADEYVFTNLV